MQIFSSSFPVEPSDFFEVVSFVAFLKEKHFDNRVLICMEASSK